MKTLFAIPITDILHLDKPSRYAISAITNNKVVFEDKKWEERVEVKIPFHIRLLMLFLKLDVKILGDIDENELLSNGYNKISWLEAIEEMKLKAWIERYVDVNEVCARASFAKQWTDKIKTFKNDEFMDYSYSPWVFVLKKNN